MSAPGTDGILPAGRRSAPGADFTEDPLDRRHRRPREDDRQHVPSRSEQRNKFGHPEGTLVMIDMTSHATVRADHPAGLHVLHERNGDKKVTAGGPLQLRQGARKLTVRDVFDRVVRHDKVERAVTAWERRDLSDQFFPPDMLQGRFTDIEDVHLVPVGTQPPDILSSVDRDGIEDRRGETVAGIVSSAGMIIHVSLSAYAGAKGVRAPRRGGVFVRPS